MENIDGIEEKQLSAEPAEPNSNEFKKYDLLKEYIGKFKQSHNIDKEYNKKIKGLGEGEKKTLFDKLIEGYYQILINALKKLAKYNKKYTDELIGIYIEMWTMAPRLKDKDYFTPYLYDLCEFLFENKELGKLTFFYNLMIFSREIPFLEDNTNEETEGYLRDAHLQIGEEDPFEEFRKIKQRAIPNSFDINLFNRTYERFFQILNFWKERAGGYYSKDEIFFMTGLFILDELIDLFYIKNEEKLSGVKGFKSIGENKNIYNPVLDDKIHGELMAYYDTALKYFKKALAYNPGNPRYFYEYAKCLRNSGKSSEAEIFFRKAFDLNTNENG